MVDASKSLWVDKMSTEFTSELNTDSRSNYRGICWIAHRDGKKTGLGTLDFIKKLKFK